MNETITLDVELHAFVRRDTEERWTAVCPSIGVASQGTSAVDAKRCIDEVVQESAHAWHRQNRARAEA